MSPLARVLYINQSINQSTKQLNRRLQVIQSINQSIDQTIKQKALSQSINQSITYYWFLLIALIKQSINQSISDYFGKTCENALLFQFSIPILYSQTKLKLLVFESLMNDWYLCSKRILNLIRFSKTTNFWIFSLWGKIENQNFFSI